MMALVPEKQLLIRFQAIFLSGGFSGSKYLRDCVEHFARSRDVGFYWPEKERYA